jgi:hypothetical protein
LILLSSHPSDLYFGNWEQPRTWMTSNTNKHSCPKLIERKIYLCVWQIGWIHSFHLLYLSQVTI